MPASPKAMLGQPAAPEADDGPTLRQQARAWTLNASARLSRPLTEGSCEEIAHDLRMASTLIGLAEPADFEREKPVAVSSSPPAAVRCQRDSIDSSLADALKYVALITKEVEFSGSYGGGSAYIAHEDAIGIRDCLKAAATRPALSLPPGGEEIATHIREYLAHPLDWKDPAPKALQWIKAALKGQVEAKLPTPDALILDLARHMVDPAETTYGPINRRLAQYVLDVHDAQPPAATKPHPVAPEIIARLSAYADAATLEGASRNDLASLLSYYRDSLRAGVPDA